MFYRPAAGLILAEQLLKLGYSVEIYGAMLLDRTQASGIMDKWMLGQVALKSFDMPLQAENLAILALAGFFRKYGFAAIC